MLNIESGKRGDICLKYWHTNKMDVCVMLLLRQFGVMAYKDKRVKLRGLSLEVSPGSSPEVNQAIRICLYLSLSLTYFVFPPQS